MSDTPSQHNQVVVDQFTRQAAPFAEMPIHSDETAMRLLVEAAGITKGDSVLDVACGPGIVACAVAPLASHVTGIDITPAMIEQARQLQAKKQLSNLTWQVGDVTALPFPDGTFSVVLSRYAFHHLLEPATVLGEMARVCRPGGRVVLVDVFTTSQAQQAAYDRIEKLRDPSHTRALQLEQLTAMFQQAGAPAGRPEFYRLEVELEKLLRASSTAPGAAEEVRQLLAADVEKNETGMSPRRRDSGICFSFPVVVVAGHKIG